MTGWKGIQHTSRAVILSAWSALRILYAEVVVCVVPEVLTPTGGVKLNLITVFAKGAVGHFKWPESRANVRKSRQKPQTRSCAASL